MIGFISLIVITGIGFVTYFTCKWGRICHNNFKSRKIKKSNDKKEDIEMNQLLSLPKTSTSSHTYKNEKILRRKSSISTELINKNVILSNNEIDTVNLAKVT